MRTTVDIVVTAILNELELLEDEHCPDKEYDSLSKILDKLCKYRDKYESGSGKGKQK